MAGIASEGMSARVLQVARYLSYLHELSSVTTLMRTAVREILGCDGATFIVREGDQVHYLDEDAIAPLWKGRRFSAASCISGWSIARREPVAIEDIHEDARIPQAYYKSTFVRSLAMMPIRFEDPVGALGAYWAAHHRPSIEEMHALRGLADITSLVLPGLLKPVPAR